MKEKYQFVNLLSLLIIFLSLLNVKHVPSHVPKCASFFSARSLTQLATAFYNFFVRLFFSVLKIMSNISEKQAKTAQKHFPLP